VSNDIREAVGRRVRELRLEVGLSQEELATRAGLHRNYTGRIERAEQDIGITALSQLVKALGISLSDFFAPFRQR
jgi:XRE family transcriptional regulator, regulator of sulfur utilization